MLGRGVGQRETRYLSPFSDRVIRVFIIFSREVFPVTTERDFTVFSPDLSVDCGAGVRLKMR